MSSRAELDARRAALIAESDAYREGIADALQVWETTLDRVDRVLDATAQIRRLAPWLGIVFGAAMFFVPKGAAVFLGRAQNAWKSVSSILSIASGMRG
ncbi:MAG: YqjK family protein [Candidatus Eiseniibacteriota bacterium]